MGLPLGVICVIFAVSRGLCQAIFDSSLQKANFCFALHLEVAAAYISTPHAAEICAP
jgi:hypothetical protein